MTARLLWDVDDVYGNTHRMALAPTWGETDAVLCETCDTFLSGNQFWGLQKVTGLHSSGNPDHTIRRLRIEREAVEA